MNEDEKHEKRPARLWVTVVAVTAGLLAYSQQVAYFGNESFHLLAAHLINAGKRPYEDFFYQHVPLYAYLNAGWMRGVGESWRSAHVFSAAASGWSPITSSREWVPAAGGWRRR